jgi:hypothetical protein
MVRKTICQVFLCCAAALGWQSGGQAQSHEADVSPVIGIIVSAHGNWYDEAQNPRERIWRMYPVHRDSRLVRETPTNGRETITIRSRWGAEAVFDCSKPRELGCTRPLDLSRILVQEKQKNVVTGFLDAVLQLATDRPKIFDTFREGILQVRGSDGNTLSDGVAELTKGGIDLKEILSGLNNGRYLLELCPLDATGKPQCAKPPAPVSYEWRIQAPAVYPAGDLHSGMYRLYRWDDANGTGRRTGEYAEVLLTDEKQYQTLSDQFRLAVDATRSWDAEDSTAPGLRRAYLYTLSQR